MTDYDKIFEEMRPGIQKILEKISEAGVPLVPLLKAAGISPEDTATIESFMEELRKYFRKLEITTYEAELHSGERVVKFVKGLEEEEEEYEKFLGIFNSLGRILDKYLSDNSEGFSIDSEDLIKYVNESIPLKEEETDALHFLDGLQWYLSSRVGIDMSLRPLILMKTGDIKGLTLVFEKI